MKFLCLAYGAEKDWMALPKEKQAELSTQDDRLRARGDLTFAVAHPTCVRAWDDGTPVATPGSFAQSELPLVGFGLIEARDLEEAVALVGKTPCAVAGGVVEVWPVQP